LTFPSAPSITTSQQSSDTTTHVISLGTYAAGDLLIILFTSDGNAGGITKPTGWSDLPGTGSDGANNVNVGAWYLVATGSEGSSVNVTTGSTQRSSTILLRYTSHDSSQAPEAVSFAGGSSVNPDSGAITASVADRDCQYITWYGKDRLDNNVSTYPTNYDDNQTAHNDGGTGTPAGGCAMAMATRNLNTNAAENPGQFALAATEQWAAGTIVVYGPTGGGNINTNTLESTVAVADALIPFLLFSRELTSSLTLFDELVSIVSGTVIKILDDTLTITDGFVASSLRNRLLQDTLTISEGTLETYITTNLVAEETLDVVDAALKQALFYRVGSDSITLTDDFIKSIVNYVVQTLTLSSTISVADEEMHFAYVERLVESALALFDEQLPNCLRFIMLSDALSVDDPATATYIPDPGPPGEVPNPVIRVGHDQPRIDLGGYALN
jgi:hypothetical protein